MTKKWLFVALALAFVSCDEVPPTAPNQVNVNVNVNQNNGVPNASPSASPTPPSGCRQDQIRQVRVNPFGFRCNGVPTPNNSGGVLPFGCVADVTATPKGDPAVYPPNGDLPVGVHGTLVTWSVTVGSDRVGFAENNENNFNGTVTPRPNSAPGDFQLTAVVCGVSGAWTARTVN